MISNTQREHKNVIPAIPFQKSKTAFLINGLDSLDSDDKPYHVEEWDFSTSHVVGISQSLKIRFETTNPEYVKGIQDALYKMYHHSKEEETLPPSVSSMTNLKVGLQRVVDCLEGTKWNDLSDRRKWKSFTRRLKKQEHSKSTLNAVLSALNKLTIIGEMTSYIDADELRKCASSKPTKQHVAIPHKLYQHLMSNALRIVEKYHEHRHEISRVLGEAYDIKQRVKNGERLIGTQITRRNVSMTDGAIERRVRRAVKKISHGIPDFEVDLGGRGLSEILTSCLIVVQGFSGVRIGEALSFNKRSVKRKTVNGKPVVLLEGQTTKGYNSIPKTVTWQSHPVAETALELAYDMMESTRSLYHKKVDEREAQGETPEKIKHMRRQLESAFLVVNQSMQRSDNYLISIFQHIRKFVNRLSYSATQEDVDEFDMLNPTREGELEVGSTYAGLSSHDFRRTFAVFFVRYGFGTASGIKFQFKHQNISMSDYYANNAVLAKMNDILMDDEVLMDLKEAGIDLGVDEYDDILNKSEHLSGARGEKIMQDRMKALESGESIIMTRAEIEENIRNGNFHIIQLPSGAYCTNASCDRVCGTQPFRAEIKECEHKVVTDKGAKMIAKQRERLIAKFTALNTGDPLKSSILTGLKQKIQVEELTLNRHEIPYTPFKDEIILNRVL
ncbi:TPA: hypothetical protein NJ132_000383 [Vibrio parahaemolyticus]|nr:hypothetical protein [Vibrio parahaemolyticus]HCE1695182.1 hypothetical protein [Vibrio parahaemolyticus]HCE1699839.1 hypothetical protein [Vibrio parahaemolyticus]HCE3048985.1 hypothetical protein [Vibrio parahaemolyticus]HCE3053131.1 hypothetical protein [Vibrio parahaemolyticus]